MRVSLVLLRFALLAFLSVFSIANPFSTAPLSVTLTEGDPPAKRQRTARRAVATAGDVTRLLGSTGLQLVSWLMGLLRAVIAVPCILNGLQDALASLRLPS